MSVVVDQSEIEISADEELQDLEQELETETEEPEEPKFEIPEKFKDKPVEDIVRSYTELEKEFGRRSNEIGEQRKLIDQLLDLKSKTEPKQERKKIEFDSLVDDPDTAISEAVSNNPVIRDLQEKLERSQRDTQQKAFESKHPDYLEIGQSTEFHKFVQSNPLYQSAFQQASNFDYNAADNLLSLYKQATSAAKQDAMNAKTAKKDQVLKDAAVEKSSSGVSKKKIFRRTDLLNMRVNNPDEFNRRQDEILLAYAEGRVK